MTPLHERRFLFVTGKGGVGKTTVTAALALSLAARGKKVLCAACNAKERFSTIFGSEPVGSTIVNVAPGVDAVNIEPGAAMEEYGMMMLKSRTLYRAVFDNRYTRSFFRAVPGLYEWAMLGKAWYHAADDVDVPHAHYDVVLLDAPATGHGLDMLRVPKVLCDIAPPGILRRDAEKAWTMFQDEKRTGVIVVTLPEDMPVNETLELMSAMEADLKLPVATVVINGFLPPLFEKAERESLLTVPSPSERVPNEPGTEALAAGSRRAARELVQADALARLQKAVSAPTIYLPHLFDEASSLRGVRELQKRF
jgi:anion-transporting  ArsA/GET3 family ATPase